MPTPGLPRSLAELLIVFGPCFTAPTFRTFWALVTGSSPSPGDAAAKRLLFPPPWDLVCIGYPRRGRHGSGVFRTTSSSARCIAGREPAPRPCTSAGACSCAPLGPERSRSARRTGGRGTRRLVCRRPSRTNWRRSSPQRRSSISSGESASAATTGTSTHSSGGGQLHHAVEFKQAERSRYSMALTSSRRSWTAGRPPGLGAGISDANSAHWASVRSVG
jgi:hypothetical protein